MTENRYQRALKAHKALLIVAAAYVVAVLSEALWMGVPPFALLNIFNYMICMFLICLIYMAGMYMGTFMVFFFQESRKARSFFKGHALALKRLDPIERDYIGGDRLLWGIMGFFVLMPDNFFFIAKCLIPYVNPFKNMQWDVTFAKIDKALHFGHHPADFLIPLVNAIPGAAHVLDFSYAGWMILMTLVTGYNLFNDTMIHRRLRYLSVYLVSWIIFGTVAATYFSSVGPLFYHDFFPNLPDPFAVITKNLDEISRHSFFVMAITRHKLLEWTTNNVLFDPNSLSSMPSMHVGVSWLIVLYARQVNRWLFILSIAVFFLVLLAVIYFGMHYAIDAYVMIIAISFLWWISGKVLDKHYTRDQSLKGTA